MTDPEKPDHEWTVFVGNIADDVEVDFIKDEFGKFGDIRHISFDIASAYIRYSNENDARQAVNEMDGKEFLGEKLRVEFSDLSISNVEQMRSESPEGRLSSPEHRDHSSPNLESNYRPRHHDDRGSRR